MKFSERLRGLRIQNSMTQKELGAKVGVSDVTVRNWESGTKQPSMQAIIALSNALRTSSDYLLGVSDNISTISPMTRAEATLLSNFRSLDSYGRRVVSTVCNLESKRVLETLENINNREEDIIFIKRFIAPAAAGYAAPIEGDDYELIPMDESVPKSTDFAVKIQGDSMAPYINDGDTVYVKQCEDRLNIGDVGIFSVDGATYCKIFYEDSDNNITLVSANPDMETTNVFIPYDSGRSISCFGKVLLKKKIPFPDYFKA